MQVFISKYRSSNLLRIALAHFQFCILLKAFYFTLYCWSNHRSTVVFCFSWKLVQDPSEKRKQCYDILAFLFCLQKHCYGDPLFFTSNSLNTMDCGSKIGLICRTILIVLSVKGTKWYIFILGGTTRICESAKYEHANNKRWLCKEWAVTVLNLTQIFVRLIYFLQYMNWVP